MDEHLDPENLFWEWTGTSVPLILSEKLTVEPGNLLRMVRGYATLLRCRTEERGSGIDVFFDSDKGRIYTGHVAAIPVAGHTTKVRIYAIGWGMALLNGFVDPDRPTEIMRAVAHYVLDTVDGTGRADAWLAGGVKQPCAKGRPRNPVDDWAWEQVNVLKCPRAEVYEEWLERIGLRKDQLVDPRDSFNKAVRPNRGKKNIRPD